MIGALLLCMTATLAAPDEFDDFFKEFAAKRAGIQILEADIEERTFEFDEVNLRTGHVVFGQPRRIIFRYDNDEPTVMVDDRRVYEYDPLEEQLQIYDIDDSPESAIFFLGFDSDPGALREAYDVRLFTTKNDQGNQGIIIRPFKENMENAPFQEVSIYLRDEDFLPYMILINLDDDAKMRTEFSNFKTNQAIPPSKTQLRIPADTRIIENGEVTIHAVPPGGLLVPPTPLDVPTDAAGVSEKEKDAPAPAPASDAKADGLVQVEVLPAP